MAGGYKLMMTRATVTVMAPEGTGMIGNPVKAATVSVRDGVATLSSAIQSVSMDVATVARSSAKRATVTGVDGTTWEIVRGCGCGGGR